MKSYLAYHFIPNEDYSEVLPVFGLRGIDLFEDLLNRRMTYILITKEDLFKRQLARYCVFLAKDYFRGKKNSQTTNK